MMIHKYSIKAVSRVMLLLAVLMAFQSTPAAAPVIAATAPELPRVYLDTTYPTLLSGHAVIRVDQTCSGIANCTTNLQTAINNAQPGDEIVLTSGQTFSGSFVLKNKASGN